MTSPMSTLSTCLLRARLPVEDEKRLQAAIETRLAAHAIEAKREVQLGAGPHSLGTIDFLTAHGIGIEVKIKGGSRAIWAQLCRYAQDRRVTALALVTAKPFACPAFTPLGTPVTVINLSQGWL